MLRLRGIRGDILVSLFVSWAAASGMFYRTSKGREKVPNGKAGDNPLSDLKTHGAHPFPRDIEQMLLRIDALGRIPGRWSLGENWPFSPQEFDWEQGKNLDNARR